MSQLQNLLSSRSKKDEIFVDFPMETVISTKPYYSRVALIGRYLPPLLRLSTNLCSSTSAVRGLLPVLHGHENAEHIEDGYLMAEILSSSGTKDPVSTSHPFTDLFLYHNAHAFLSNPKWRFVSFP